MEPDEVLPADPSQTVETALGISEKRHTQLTWIIEEMCIVGGTKADAIKKIAAMNVTEEEKVYLGFILCKKYVSVIPYIGKMILSRL
jgi:hypothetical protein